MVLFNKPDESLWQIIINAYYPKLVNMIFYLTRDYHAAEDIVQEAFAKAICNFHQLRDPDKIKPWLTQIVLNTAKTWVKKNSQMTYLAEIEVAASSFDMASDEAIKTDTKKAVLEAIQTLSPQEQKVVILRFYFDLLEKDIANILGISEGTVKSVIYRSKNKLRQQLSDLYKEGCDDDGRK